jgi:hypothetical protein
MHSLIYYILIVGSDIDRKYCTVSNLAHVNTLLLTPLPPPRCQTEHAAWTIRTGEMNDTSGVCQRILSMVSIT